MGVYFINTHFDPVKPVTDAIRQEHLAYIGTQKPNICYGGLKMGSKGETEGICYFITAENLSEAEQFVRSDPYYDLYRKVDLKAFVQRIP